MSDENNTFNNDFQAPDYKPPGSGFGIASMVCGILALITCCIWCTCIPLAVVSIVLGILQIQKGTAKGMAIAGIVCSSIGLILFIALTLWGSYLESTGFYQEFMQEYMVPWGSGAESKCDAILSKAKTNLCLKVLLL